jgi:dTDP-glucose pyrophosphorylase|tara:strand:- start:2699 stop:3745 length:1047 start_codon:yes stop_codon:yes gene_type:complete
MKKFTIFDTSTIKQSIKKLNETGEKTLVVVNKDQVLLGTVSDGDIRKAILKKLDINRQIKSFYQKKPFFLYEDKININKARKIFLDNNYGLIPIVSSQKKLINILFLKDVMKNKKIIKQKISIPIIIMAGGKGTRMEPFTSVLPKPLLPINGKTVIDHIIDNFLKYGAKNFTLSVNYKSKILKAFFMEKDKRYKIKFIEENKPLGTAGSLRLLKNKIKTNFIVTNCDVIFMMNYKTLYDYHNVNKYDLTLVACHNNFTIPYGICSIDKNNLFKKIEEKPKIDILANGGFYILKPSMLELIPKDKEYHMTDLINDAKKINKKIGIFPVSDECWIDIGQWDTYKKFNGNI